MNLLLLEEVELTGDDSARVVGPRATHVAEVLRAQPGQRLRVGLRGGHLGHATVEGASGGTLVLREVTLTEPPPARAGVGLLLAMPRPKALRRILPAVASLGVDTVVVLNASQVDRAYLGSPVLAPDSVRRLLDLGLEQAQDTRAPQFRLEPRFRPFVEDTLPSLVAGSAVRWLLDPGPDSAPARHASGVRWLAVGPETGWTDFERGLLGTAGFEPVSLGPRMLRVETVVPFAIGRL